MDNAAIHRSLLYMNTIIKPYFRVIYNAPYTLQLNPIEYFFSCLKSHLKKNIYYNDPDKFIY